SCAGNPKPATRMPASTARFTTLSNINPKKALMSPFAAHRYAVRCVGAPEPAHSGVVMAPKIGWRRPPGYRSFFLPQLPTTMRRHCLLYHGSFERNYPNLKPGSTTFEGTDGAQHPLPSVPPEVDGVRVGY